MIDVERERAKSLELYVGVRDWALAQRRTPAWQQLAVSAQARIDKLLGLEAPLRVILKAHDDRPAALRALEAIIAEANADDVDV
jgi:hypothetical protein